MLEISYSINVDDDVFREHFAKYIHEANDAFDYLGFIDHLSKKSGKLIDQMKLPIPSLLNLFIDVFLAIQSDMISDRKKNLDRLIANDHVVDFN